MARSSNAEQRALADDWPCGDRVVHLDAVQRAWADLPPIPFIAGMTDGGVSLLATANSVRLLGRSSQPPAREV